MITEDLAGGNSDIIRTGDELTAIATFLRTYEGWFARSAKLVLKNTPRDGWRLEPGQDTVIVLYSSSRQRDAPDTVELHDMDVFNDELVLRAPRGDVVSGARLDLAVCGARYQRGSTRLEYVSRVVNGELRIEQAQDRLLQGSFSLRSVHPDLDVQGLGDVVEVGTFVIEPHEG